MPVDDLLFQNRKEAFAPRVVARFSDCGEALLPAIGGYLLLYLGRCVLAAAVTVKDDIGGQMPANLSGFQRLQDKFLFHILCLAGSQNGIAENVADLAKVVKTFAGSDIADITGQNLKRSGYLEPLRQVFVFVAARFAAVCQRTLPTPAMAGSQPFLRQNALHDWVGCRVPVASQNPTDSIDAVNALAVIEHGDDLLPAGVAGSTPTFSPVQPGVIPRCGNAKFFGPLRPGVFGFGVHQVVEIRCFYF
ncbi:hypothetical protein SDC9_69477 [bioreactor metagenome]|uniref:Uncharacterized protein n=1 Tax=bioreactor metagenome TaxID=1076179 RepID=A0A644Y392_9ZZZZ